VPQAASNCEAVVLLKTREGPSDLNAACGSCYRTA